MWGYYGSKSKVIKHYPKPKFGHIVEPFAGTAQYSLMYFENEVTLIDKYDKIVKIWKWLQSCSPKDVLETRKLEFGENVDSFEWDCEERKWMVGFIIVGAATQPKKTASRWKTVVRPNTQSYKLDMIAKNLYKIRHWNISVGDYIDCSNKKATWFIDPPYLKGGEHYVHSSKDIDYGDLSSWCKSRQGQVIVCEKTGADWLPFKHLVSSRGAKFNHDEAIWVNEV